MSLITGIVASLLLALNTLVVCVPLYLMGLVRAPLTDSAKAKMSRAMDGIIDAWVGFNRALFRGLRLTRVDVRWHDAEQLDRNRWYLVISNHQTWADIVLLQTTLWRRIPPLKFFTKKQLIWVPLLGGALWLLGFPYVSRANRRDIAANPELLEKDRQATLAACDGFKTHPTSVLIFLEGTRYTKTKHQRQDARFRHLLNPKLGGMVYVTTSLDDHLHKLLDVTIRYPQGVPTFWQFLQGNCAAAAIDIQCRDLPEHGTLVNDRDQRSILGPWVETLWREKDFALESCVETNG